MEQSGFQMSELNDFILKRTKQKFATNVGTAVHKKLQFIIIDDDLEQGDTELINKIKSVNGLSKLFSANSETEVPIAGNINGKFISRRIDRLNTDKLNKEIILLDYKTDINPEIFHDKYIYQLNEYKNLLKQIYPDFSIKCYILWISNWSLELINC